MKFRKVPVIGLVAATALVLSGCAPGNGSQTSVPTASGHKVSTHISSDPVTLTLATNQAKTLVQPYIDGFEKLHPQVTINAQYSQFSDYTTSINLAMTSSSAPDIAQYAVPMKDLIPAGKLLPLDNYAKAYGWDKKFPSAALSFQMFSKDGKRFGEGSLYGAPVALSETGVFVNTKIANQLGIDLPIKTLSGLETAMDKAKAAGYTPMQIGALDAGALHLWANLLDVMMPKADYRAWVNGQKGGSITGKGALEATTTFADWAKKGYFPSSANADSESQSAADFAQGKSLFLLNGSWAVSQITQGLGKDVGFFSMPGSSADAPKMTSGSSVSFMISSQTKHPDVAAAFLDYLGSTSAGEITINNGFMPPNPKTPTSGDGLQGDLVTSYKAVLADDGLNRFPDSAAPSIIDNLTSGLQGLIEGSGDPQQFLKQLQQVRDAYQAQ